MQGEDNNRVNAGRSSYYRHEIIKPKRYLNQVRGTEGTVTDGGTMDRSKAPWAIDKRRTPRDIIVLNLHTGTRGGSRETVVYRRSGEGRDVHRSSTTGKRNNPGTLQAEKVVSGNVRRRASSVGE